MTRWGIAGTGRVAKEFAEAMAMVSDGAIVAVASRAQDTADSFAARYSIRRAYADYRALADDASIDAVYIATPHSRHCADTVMYLKSGKHVLCEKPLALNATQASAMKGIAEDEGLFLMEAIWSRFLPAYGALCDVLGEEQIGVPQLVEADFGFPVAFDPHSRYFDPALGGGALLDLGIYPLQLCSLVLGDPDRVSGFGVLGETGVDEVITATLTYKTDQMAVVKASVRVSLACTARISGTEGWIEIPSFMHCPDHITVTNRRGLRQIDSKFGRGGFRFEISEVHRCISEGRLESCRMPLSESVTLAATMDQIRSDIGVRYPDDRPQLSEKISSLSPWEASRSS